MDRPGRTARPSRLAGALSRRHRLDPFGVLLATAGLAAVVYERSGPPLRYRPRCCWPARRWPLLMRRTSATPGGPADPAGAGIPGSAATAADAAPGTEREPAAA